jgi:hypothetical protein
MQQADLRGMLRERSQRRRLSWGHDPDTEWDKDDVVPTPYSSAGYAPAPTPPPGYVTYPPRPTVCISTLETEVSREQTWLYPSFDTVRLSAYLPTRRAEAGPRL